MLIINEIFIIVKMVLESTVIWYVIFLFNLFTYDVCVSIEILILKCNETKSTVNRGEWIGMVHFLQK